MQAVQPSQQLNSVLSARQRRAFVAYLRNAEPRLLFSTLADYE
jgi:hypothetical protein